MVPTSPGRPRPWAGVVLTQLSSKESAIASPRRTRLDMTLLAEMMARSRVVVVASELGIEKFGGERINAHAGRRPVGLAGHRRRVLRFFAEIDDPRIERSTTMSPKCEASARATSTQATVRATTARGRGCAPACLFGIIHLVDMIAGQDDGIPRSGGAQNIEVLIDGVGGAAVPRRLVEPLLRRQ